jgi:hypothetical protein
MDCRDDAPDLHEKEFLPKLIRFLEVLAGNQA